MFLSVRKKKLIDTEGGHVELNSHTESLNLAKSGTRYSLKLESYEDCFVLI